MRAAGFGRVDEQQARFQMVAQWQAAQSLQQPGIVVAALAVVAVAESVVEVAFGTVLPWLALETLFVVLMLSVTWELPSMPPLMTVQPVNCWLDSHSSLNFDSASELEVASDFDSAIGFGFDFDLNSEREPDSGNSHSGSESFVVGIRGLNFDCLLIEPSCFRKSKVSLLERSKRI